jgi:CRP-like cAMP-binding protein
MKSSDTFIASERVFEKLRALCTERTVEGSTVLFGQGETPKEVVLVLHGEIALTPDATEPTLCRIASAGTVLGVPAILGRKGYSLTAVAVSKCVLAIVPRERFLAALQTDPEMTLGIVRMLAEEISEMQNLSVQFRLAHMNELAIQ